MCGRYALHKDHPINAAAFDIKSGPEDLFRSGWARPRYNIAPTQDVVAVISNKGQRHAQMMRWGLIPFWARDLKNGKTPMDARGKVVNTPINARAETIETTRSFNMSFQSRRCLIPADGFYEWKGSKSARRPMYITLRSGEPFAMAGLWGAWKGPDGEWIHSCTIVTTVANRFIEPIHDRMPVILTKGAESIGLDQADVDVAELKEVLVPYPPGEMSGHEVSRLVNSVKNDSPQCIEAVQQGTLR